MHTVRSNFDVVPTVRFGAVLRNRDSYGAVRCRFESKKILRCGLVRFSKIVNATVRFGVFIYPTVRFGAVFGNQESYGAVRCSFEEGNNPTVLFGAVTEPIEKTAP